MLDLSTIDPARPVLIHGPTASGKSALALRIAQAQGGVIVNADALQVYRGWPLLSAQPDAEERAAAPHALYGHLPHDAAYSAGDWLRDVAPFLTGPTRPIIVGGTGLYFMALTEGLAEIPPTPSAVRRQADALPLETLIATLDAETRAGLDLMNRARVQRAWEVQQATGRSIRAWQAATPPPLLPVAEAVPLVLVPGVDWLNARIEARFDRMLAAGALAEARAMRPYWDPAQQSARTIGAAELISHLDGEITLEAARDRAVIASRRYGKRQRTWARARLRAWRWLDLPGPA
ncbi:MAG: tRNA (adenosine(37)-N6)-dimethylallyltransferase MiaA [Salibaculum sp.]|uniref:tRNA (adenosine(37)-N6)-dimethylallyltransferase MiaA n=2 Tax=Roseobacteraceae TaxID=2854170 RepID=UPI0028705D29|nr:tRNA (adenosine(37)-N6)-dimethylallyltransferase MiaA [Salibaculum sp.]MDR9428039.1 tRNA (adenosine(37)-N6)-dimethylallyltransferase MiaA [Salibaculum sp.]MDR9482375.1 tRNA (adenosine(37)-N6)-dimethylallyltransferase MiaA [Salibaculum sp.]